MDRGNSRQKLLTRRAALLVGGKLSLVGLLLGRMYYLQVLQSDQYQMLAEENRINMRLLAPPRGRILDRFGDELATNRQNFRILLVPEQTESVEETLRRLAALIDLDEYDHARVLREVRRQHKFVPVTVAENLTWEEFARLNVHSHELPGVQPDVGETRYYPYGDVMVHVVGYVSAVSEREQTGDPLLELPGFRIGKNGIEKTYDEALRGSAGSSRVEVNAFGRVIRELAREDGTPGQDVVLTIDAGLQSFIADRLAGQSASAVAMDIHTGDLLAMVSTPGYDPNAFNLGISVEAWQALLNNPLNPLINKAVAGQYPPGSTFKMLVAMAALAAGEMTPETRVFCNGAMHLGRHIFHCWRWKYGGHGHVNMRQAIAQSCDVFFYEAAKRIGVDRISEMAGRFGLGQAPDVGLTSEQAGFLPTTAWKEAVRGEPWHQGETLITGIGQGYVLATPLQLAVMTARMANGGFAVKPRLVREAADDTAAPAPWPAVGVSPAALKVALDGMIDVINGKRGTARHARLPGELMMAGKTGTAQVRRITRAERQAGIPKNDERPWEERDHGLFVGFAPVGAPRYATAVVLEHGGSGGNAASATRDIMIELLKRDPSRRPAVDRVAMAVKPGAATE